MVLKLYQNSNCYPPILLPNTTSIRVYTAYVHTRSKSKSHELISLSITLPSHRLRHRDKLLAASITAFACCNCLLSPIPELRLKKVSPQHSKTCCHLSGLIALPPAGSSSNCAPNPPTTYSHPHPHGLIISSGIRILPECLPSLRSTLETNLRSG